jgi:competence protein ComEC
LVNSPKINLERLIFERNPQVIIADNSNYNFLHSKWSSTCLKKKVTFYSIKEKGAFILK